MSFEESKGYDDGAVAVINPVREMGSWRCDWMCEKWSQEAVDFCINKLMNDGVERVQDGNREVNGVIVPNLIPVHQGITNDLLRKIVGEPEEVVEVAGNILMNVGIIALLTNLITVPASTAVYDNTHSRLGVGNSNTAEAATQTDLQAAAGSANRQFKLQNASYPQRPGSNGNQSCDWRADFLTGEANFAWQEWCIDNGTSNGTTVSGSIVNRKVQSLGTKTTGTWTLTATITIS